MFTRIPVYATTPVISLGRTLLQDLYASTPLASSIVPTDALAELSYSFPFWKDGNNPNILMQAPTPDEITKYFGLIKPLKYSQPLQPPPSPFSPPLGGLTITAYSAGHTLGGTIWHIQHGMESVVYAVDWNQAREHVLSGAAWLGGPATGGSEVLEQLRRPTAMVCSSRGSGLATIAGQGSKRDEALLSLIRDTVANGGSVLIPSDSSARILELAYILEETWSKEMSQPEGTSPLRNAKVYLASRTSGATMRYARSMLEWMEEGIVKDSKASTMAQDAQDQRRNRGQQDGAHGDDDKAGGSFDFRHITLLERKSRVTRMLESTEPRVILASDTSLEWGFSKDALKTLASEERNLVILTERIADCGTQQKGLGKYLWDLWDARNATSDQDSLSAEAINVSGNQATFRSARAVALEGNELPLYQQYLAQQRQLQTTMQGDSSSALETSADMVDDRSSSTSETSEDSDTEHQGKALNTATTLRHARKKLGLSDEELGVNILIERKNVFDYDVRGKKGKDKMFPYAVAKRRRAEDFGDLIRPAEFVRTEEEQVTREALRDGTKKENAVGQTRKWEEEEEGEEEEEDPDRVKGPSKVILGTEVLELHCRIAFVDFSGLHDRRTIQMLLPLIKPRKLILVAGDEADTKDLAEDCQKVLKTGSTDTVDIFTPGIGAVIDASVDTNAWSVKLSRDLVRTLQWQTVRGLGVVPITGRLAAISLEPNVREEDGMAKKKAKLDATAPSLTDDDKMDTTPILDVVPTNSSTAARSVAQPFHVGDLRLADLRKIMQESGMTAEFRGEGVLVINGTVSVKKSAMGKIEIDGAAYSLDNSVFFNVRKIIYEALAAVAGG